VKRTRLIRVVALAQKYYKGIYAVDAKGVPEDEDKDAKAMADRWWMAHRGYVDKEEKEKKGV